VALHKGRVDENGKLKLAGKGDVWLSKKWKDYLQAINPPGGADFALEPQAGWLNANIKADTLGFGGNFVEVLRTVGVYAQVKCFNDEDDPPDPTQSNYLSGDPRIQKWTVVTQRGNIINPAKGRDIYTVLIGSGDLWLHVSRLEFFPDLPMDVQVSWKAWRGLFVRSSPERNSDNVIGVVGPYSFSHPITLLEYAPRGSSVWAKVRLVDGKEGYLAALWYPAPKQLNYYTSWKMLTDPPIAPQQPLNFTLPPADSGH
jgi:hypothetical protein